MAWNIVIEQSWLNYFLLDHVIAYNFCHVYNCITTHVRECSCSKVKQSVKYKICMHIKQKLKILQSHTSPKSSQSFLTKNSFISLPGAMLSRWAELNIGFNLGLKSNLDNVSWLCNHHSHCPRRKSCYDYNYNWITIKCKLIIVINFSGA